ncbi:peptide ligase PGM1-related protein [Streptomyces sp. NBC_00454]|uniref:preATP grasp domain-containing protein n=1 Tax=Streptomyces sp. NBC_00454 TaxID=2975747 RepID=UPI0030E2829D
MSRILIGNAYNEHLVSDHDTISAEERPTAGNIALRLLWLTEVNDVVIVPQAPDPQFVRYVLSLKGLAPDAVSVLVPPPGRFGMDVLTRERLLDETFLRDVAAVAEQRGVDTVLPYCFDSTIARFARRLDLAAGTPGFRFLEAGGSEMLNSKAAFRTLASGVGAALVDGVTTASREHAESFIGEVLGRGAPVIVKQDFHQGGFGNDILTPRGDVEPIGAPRAVLLVDEDEIARHLDRYWAAYTGRGAHRVVIEEYIPDSLPLGAEVNITEDVITVHHVGEMRMAPIYDGMAIPGSVATRAQQSAYVEAMVKLSAPIQAMGYRGVINIDGILTPGGEVFLSEFNGRMGGTTHLHWIGESFLGADYQSHRLLVTRNHWHVPSFAEALDALGAAGLSFDPQTGRGVIIACDHVRQSGAVEYCAVAESAEDAALIEKKLTELFA